MSAAKIEGYKITVDLSDMLGNLTGEQRAQLIDALACQSEIINEVANQIIEGVTTDGSHGPRSFGGDVDATYGIDGARMRIAKASSEIAAEEIAALGRQIKIANDSAAKAWANYHDLLDSRRLA